MKRWFFVLGGLYMAAAPWPVDAPHLVALADWLWKNGGEGMRPVDALDCAFHAGWAAIVPVALLWPWLRRSPPAPA